MIYKAIYRVQKLVDVHKQQKRISRADQEGAERKELDDLQLTHHAFATQRSSTRGVNYVPSFKIWTCRFRGCQKTTQRVRKMKPSGVHWQTHMYREVCRALKSCMKQ